jgi:hypothetical protein
MILVITEPLDEVLEAILVQKGYKIKKPNEKELSDMD